MGLIYFVIVTCFCRGRCGLPLGLI